jgi:hypothetical protein
MAFKDLINMVLVTISPRDSKRKCHEMTATLGSHGANGLREQRHKVTFR